MTLGLVERLPFAYYSIDLYGGAAADSSLPSNHCLILSRELFSLSLNTSWSIDEGGVHAEHARALISKASELGLRGEPYFAFVGDLSTCKWRSTAGFVDMLRIYFARLEAYYRHTEVPVTFFPVLPSEWSIVDNLLHVKVKQAKKANLMHSLTSPSVITVTSRWT